MPSSEHSMVKSGEQEGQDDLMYSRSNFFEDRDKLARVEERSELSSVSELEDVLSDNSVKCHTPLTA